MVRFANTCLQRVNELTILLQSSLGPGTEELAMRIGIHSGPVTAGVLRGEKSRFQLFGDTMNTAARMESTGLKNRVHLSKDTANSLIVFGKSAWIQEREDVVTAKGKGELKTFWLLPNCGIPGMSKRTDPVILPTEISDQSKSKEEQGASENVDSNVAISTMEKRRRIHLPNRQSWGINDAYAERTDRLIDWNVDILMNLLKKIMARRAVVPTNMSEQDQSYHGKIALDEIKEVIKMPTFSPEAAIKIASDSTVAISPEVRSEMRDFVRRIAAHYQDNPFHNFEHASHGKLTCGSRLCGSIVYRV